MPDIIPPSIWIEGERIPDEQLRDIFRPPPGVPATFLRSTLVIGSRGAGKTTLFRYQKLTHRGIAIHINLAAEFSSLTKQTGFGPLAFDIPQSMEPLLVGKATSLLALTVAERLAKKSVEVRTSELRPCLPSTLVPSGSTVDTNWIFDAKKAVASAPLESFQDISNARPLPTFISSLGESSMLTERPLLLLLDRGDTVQAPTLVPVLELLDQSSHFTVLLAMRPGHAGQALSSAGGVVPGDHYQVVHLGITPRSQEWCDFMAEAVRAQFKNMENIPKETKAWIIALSRDSLRSALELFARYLTVPSSRTPEAELSVAIDDLKENQMAAAQQTLQRYHPNFRDMVNRFRTSAIQASNGIGGPVVLSIKPQPQELLFEPPSRISRFLDVALRTGALCMPENTRWVPGSKPTELEIPPILIWRKGDATWSAETAKPVNLVIEEEDLLRQFGGPPKPPTIFVAYRMNFPESQKFRADLKSAFASHPDLCTVNVVDGHTPAGVKWGPTIRERIKKAKAVVGDVTGMRSDVVFEIGFAFGLKKAVIPVVQSFDDHAMLPRWLSAMQLGHFGTKEGIIGIVGSVAKHLSDPEYLRILKAPQPIPALAVWLRQLDWNSHVLDQFKTTATRGGMKPEIITMLSEEAIKRAASATLLVASLDGTADDALVHYVCGAIVAKPEAGSGKKLPRMIVLIEQPDVEGQSFIADSLRRCEGIVHVAKLEQVKAKAEEFLQGYRDWTTGHATREE